MLSIPEQVKQYVEAGPPCEHLGVEDGDQYFFATIVNAQFEGKQLIQRHQFVYVALGGQIRARIHTLSIKMLTPVE